MPSPPDRDPVTQALKVFLANETGKLVGVCEAPSGATPADGFYVLYPMPGGSVSGTLGEPDRQASLVYQVTSVGKRDDQVQQLADRAYDVVLDRAASGAFENALAPAGAAVIDRAPQGGRGGIEPEGSGPERVLSIPEAFVITVEPS